MESSFTSLSRIGEGSFGLVYLVEDEKGRPFALKKVTVDPFEVEQSLKEIEVMKKFVHPNLVRIHRSHFDETSNLLEIVMEYCEEGDLFKFYKSKNKRFSVE